MQCSAIAEVYLGKRFRTHISVTNFWATLYYHLAQSVDKFEHKLKAQCESTNKYRLGFLLNDDVQQFIKHVLPTLKEVGYSFTMEGLKDEYWDVDHETSSVSSKSTTSLWSSVGSKKP